MVKETILAVQEAEAQASGLVSEARQKGKELAEQTRREAQSRSEAAEREIRESMEAVRNAAKLEEKTGLVDGVGTEEEILSEAGREAEAEISLMRKRAEEKSEEAVRLITDILLKT